MGKITTGVLLCVHLCVLTSCAVVEEVALDGVEFFESFIEGNEGLVAQHGDAIVPHPLMGVRSHDRPVIPLFVSEPGRSIRFPNGGVHLYATPGGDVPQDQYEWISVEVKLVEEPLDQVEEYWSTTADLAPGFIEDWEYAFWNVPIRDPIDLRDPLRSGYAGRGGFYSGDQLQLRGASGNAVVEPEFQSNDDDGIALMLHSLAADIDQFGRSVWARAGNEVEQNGMWYWEMNGFPGLASLPSLGNCQSLIGPCALESEQGERVIASAARWVGWTADRGYARMIGVLTSWGRVFVVQPGWYLMPNEGVNRHDIPWTLLHNPIDMDRGALGQVKSESAGTSFLGQSGEQHLTATIYTPWTVSSYQMGLFTGLNAFFDLRRLASHYPWINGRNRSVEIVDAAVTGPFGAVVIRMNDRATDTFQDAVYYVCTVGEERVSDSDPSTFYRMELCHPDVRQWPVPTQLAD